MARPTGRQTVYDELERVRTDFAAITTAATVPDLNAPSNGTRWTNRELLFHMVLGAMRARATFLR